MRRSRRGAYLSDESDPSDTSDVARAIPLFGPAVGPLQWSRMATLRNFVWIALSLGLVASSVRAAAFSETSAYSGAAQAFQDKVWSLAEAGFAQFAEKFPKSEQRAQAVLYQAVARFHQTNSAGVIELLQANLPRAGTLADEYQFWIAEAQFLKGDFTAAAEAYLELWRRYGASKRRIEAFVGEALSHSRLGQWTQVVTLLGNPESEFARTAVSSPTNLFIGRGLVLLGDAQLAQTNYAGVEAAVAPLSGRKLGGALDWRAEHLRFEAQLANRRLPEALGTSSNLLALAALVPEDRVELLSESVALQAGVLEQLGRRGEAKEVFKLNLPPGSQPERQRQALLRITELALAEGKPFEAASNLVSFLQQSSNSPAADVALFALGEIHLKQYVASLGTNGTAVASPSTNDLEVALGHFDRLVSTFTNSTYLGKAELNRGWCFWLRYQRAESGKTLVESERALAESGTAFARATQLLTNVEEAVIASYKLGDVRFAQTNYLGALELYRQTEQALTRWPRAGAALDAELYHQMLRASLEVTNVPVAEASMTQILKTKPRSDLADPSLLLLVQGLAEIGKPELARAEFEKFLALAPGFALRPEVEVVLGRAREQQADWPGAITGYDDWLVRFQTNALRSRVQFQRAWANYKAGRDTNALTQFTNFVAQFPTDPLAPQAQWWVADYFFRQGDQYYNAEINYKPIFHNWPTNELAFEARMMAGRAAMGGLRYNDAITHFTNLTSSLNCPRDLRAQATFAYGDALMAQTPGDTNKLANYETAIQVFSGILKTYPTNPITVLAWGEMAKCYKQLGGAGTTNAVFCFSQVVTSAVANVAARSVAQVGLAGVIVDLAQLEPREAQAPLLRQALSNLLEVVYGTNLREGETSDEFGVRRAGLEAGALLERLGDWEQAEKLYSRLQDLLPVLRTSFQKKIDQARERRAAEKSPSRG